MAVVSALQMGAIRKNFWKNGWTVIRSRQRLLSVKLRKDMDLHGLHVLLAEDNDLNAEIAVSLLEEQGMIVTRAADGKSALIQFAIQLRGLLI